MAAIRFWAGCSTSEVRAVVQLESGAFHGFRNDEAARRRLTMFPGDGFGFWRVKRK